MTTTLATFRQLHSEQLAHYVALADDLSDAQMGVTSLCPEWTVRDVIVHIVTVEAALTGWDPSMEMPPFGSVRQLKSDLDSADRPTLAKLTADVVRGRLDDLAARSDDVVDAQSFTPTGPATYGRFLQVRSFDHWVHARDIARPLGLTPPAATGAPVANAVDEVASALGYIVGKKIGLPDGLSIVFHLTGGTTRDLAAVVDGRAKAVDSVASPDVEVTADAETFVMLACGRIDPQPEIDAGRIAWTGEVVWGERAARNLRYTM